MAIEVRPGPSRFPVELPMPQPWLIAHDGPRQSPSRTRPFPPVYGCSENAPNTATLCHFSARLVRHLGGEYRDSSRERAGFWDMRCGCPAGAKTEWHRCSGVCHRDPARRSPSRADGTVAMSRPLGGVMSRESGVGSRYCLLPTALVRAASVGGRAVAGGRTHRLGIGLGRIGRWTWTDMGPGWREGHSGGSNSTTLAV
jgi:hypothetical protein